MACIQKKGDKRDNCTILKIPDELWEKIRIVLPKEKPPKTTGRPTVPYRKALDGVPYILRTGCQWKMLPSGYGSGSTCHRRFQGWIKLDIFRKIWIRLLKTYDNLMGIKWAWQQSLDSVSIKSPLGGAMTRSSPTDRGKLGTKRHILTDKEGIPLSAVMSSASNHGVKLATDVVDSAVAKRHISSAKNKRREEEENCNTFVLIRHIIPSPKSKQSQNEDMQYICHTREKEERSRKIRKRS